VTDRRQTDTKAWSAREFLHAAMRGVDCDRCDQPAEANRIDVSTWAREGYVWGRITCLTPGCVDEDGSAAVEPPDEPGQLTREDRRWLRRQRRLAAECGRVARQLEEATTGW
jgi:hypothetical protein